MRAKKGSSFERKICKVLSKWWTNGERDDVFWRSSQSGGRATERAKKGLRTYGSYGDIAAVDPIGEPLIKLFTIELKRGSSYKTPADLLDFGRNNQSHPFVACLLQAYESHKNAGSFSWLMICKRDRRDAIVYIPVRALRALDQMELCKMPPCLEYCLTLCRRSQKPLRLRFLGLPLTVFLKSVTASQIRGVALI